MRYFLTIVIVIIAIGLGLSSVYTVDRAEYVYLTQFGRHVATLDGAAEGGLHFKLPWPAQTVQRLDSRLQSFDLPETELLTLDRSSAPGEAKSVTIDKTITVVAYVCWRIAGRDQVDSFIRRVGNMDRARARLSDQVRSQLGASIGRMRMDDLFNVETIDADNPGSKEQKVDRNLEQLRQQLLHGRDSAKDAEDKNCLKVRAREDYGIDLVDIRLRRTNHPPAVRDAIYTRIRSERAKKAMDYESEGKLKSQQILSEAERKASDIRAEARAREKILKGQAEAEADLIRNQAHGKDVEFYAFLKKLEEYQRILGDNKTVLLLSSHRELFDLLFQPPRPEGSNNSNGRNPVAGTSNPKTNQEEKKPASATSTPR